MKVRSVVFLLFILTLPVIQPLDAQFSLGVNAGVTRMKFSGDPVSGYGFFKPGLGTSTALRLDYRFSEVVSLSLQPGFSQLRSSYQVMNDSGTAAIDSTLLVMNAFSLPLHAVIWSDNGRFYVLTGLQLDYTLSFKGETLITPYSSSYTSANYDVRDYQLYIQFGAGFIVPLGKPYLSFEFRYSQGLMDLNNDLIRTDSFLPRTKLANTYLLVGLHLPLGSYSEKYKVSKKRR